MKSNSRQFFEKYRKECEKCNGGRSVIIPAPDSKNATGKVQLMFINERPGPVGPAKTGFVSFCNPDASARWFHTLFQETFGLAFRRHIFITNAVIWYPQQKNYRNQTPTNQEIRCSLPILEDQIKRIKPELIVTVGAKALYAFKRYYQESKQLQEFQLLRDKGTLITDTPIPVYPICHTSRLGRIRCTEGEQIKDWAKMKRVSFTRSKK